MLGLNGRGKSHIEDLMALPGVEVAALCDPDGDLLGQRAAEFQQKYGRTVKTVKDLRRVYEDKEIDVVTVATPNHWHALATIWACQAGKDVYVEKPASHNVWEGRRLVEAARHYRRIVQHGVQLRSSVAVQEAVRHLRNGTIGKVYMARGLVYRWRPDVGRKPVEPAPAALDYDLWLGPAATRPFSRDYVHYNWHWHWDFGNGDVGNQGIHETDLCLFLGQKREKGPSGDAGGNHFANFIEAVRKRDESILNGPPETGHLASALAHLGNIAYRLGRVLHFDPAQERFKGDAEADRLLTREYRQPYAVPARFA